MTDLVLRANGRRWACRIQADGEHRLVFTRSPFGLKNEIKAMAGARWNPERKCWSIANTPRNMFQLRHMMVEPTDENPYAWFERPVQPLTDIVRPLKEQQLDMISKSLTYRYQIHAADMGMGKSLTAIEIWERLAKTYGWSEDDVASKVWFVGPKSALESVELDMYKWKVQARPYLMTYERFVIEADNPNLVIPQVIFFDECTGLKTPSTARGRAARAVADKVREVHGTDGCITLFSGTVTAKRPSDIWHQAEVAWPGFLREGSLKAFEERYATVVKGEDADGNTFKKIDGWKDDQVARIPARLEGLMNIYRKKDWLDLPPRSFERVVCKPTERIKRVAKAIVDAAPNVISGLTSLRALSSGFQYDLDADGVGGERAMVETVCPKDDVLVDVLGQESLRGRLIVGASFQGSVDRVKRICQEQGWDVITIDGRGWNCYRSTGDKVQEHVLDFWANNETRTVLVGNPGSCRFGLTLVEAKTILVYDQNFSAEHRLQFLDRNYRMGQDEPVRVIDVLHLPVDKLILDTLTENKRLEELSLGQVLETLQS